MAKEPVIVEFVSYAESVPRALDEAGAAKVLAEQKAVLIKPNLINDSPPPVTTPAACCEAIVRYVKASSNAEIVIGEGCGAPNLSTGQAFGRLGYTEMAERLGVELRDLNKEETVRLCNPELPFFKEMHIPRIALTHFIISVPVLKAHSIATITGSMKNMLGLAPPSHYERPGHWKKAAFHDRMQQAIIDLNAYRAPDLTLLDASVGLATYHLGGPHCDPPVRKLIAGFDARRVDRAAAGLLGLEWEKIGHLRD
jgi:uncharacterized protein (DUF362 family)